MEMYKKYKRFFLSLTVKCVKWHSRKRQKISATKRIVIVRKEWSVILLIYFNITNTCTKQQSFIIPFYALFIFICKSDPTSNLPSAFFPFYNIDIYVYSSLFVAYRLFITYVLFSCWISFQIQYTPKGGFGWFIFLLLLCVWPFLMWL